MIDSNSDRQNLHKIVILNPKGGSGKTTLATNIASFFALRGPPPTLIDCDPLGYSTRWLDKRSSERPKIHGIEAWEHFGPGAKNRDLHAWPDSRQMIVDLPAAIADDQLRYQTYDADSILIPVMPSEIDIYSAARFIANFLLVAQFDRRNRNLGIVANRTRAKTKSYAMLIRFLSSLDIPLIAELRDSQNFVHAASEGVGLYEMPVYKVRQDLERMDPIFGWLDKWRMRKLDAAASSRFEHAVGAEVLTPAPVRDRG